MVTFWMWEPVWWKCEFEMPWLCIEWVQWLCAKQLPKQRPKLNCHPSQRQHVLPLTISSWLPPSFLPHYHHSVGHLLSPPCCVCHLQGVYHLHFPLPTLNLLINLVYFFILVIIAHQPRTARIQFGFQGAHSQAHVVNDFFYLEII